jgi:Flp pilus assembly protein TadD
MRGLLGYVYAVSGNRSEAENTIAQLKELLPGNTRAALDLAVVFSGPGDNSSALRWLDKAQEAHVTDLIGIEQDSHLPNCAVIRDFKR